MATPLPKPTRAALGAPPTPEEVRENIAKRETQLNVRLDPATHMEIKIAAIQSGMSLGDYIVHAHNMLKQRAEKG